MKQKIQRLHFIQDLLNKINKKLAVHWITYLKKGKYLNSKLVHMWCVDFSVEIVFRKPLQRKLKNWSHKRNPKLFIPPHSLFIVHERSAKLVDMEKSVHSFNLIQALIFQKYSIAR